MFLVAAGCAVACGGTSTQDGSTTSTGGSDAGGTGSAAGGNNLGGGQGAPDLCTLPADPGSCDGYFPRLYYSAADDLCEEFVYGGCDGNENNFETVEECEQACRPGVSPIGLDSCVTPVDCAVVGVGCCGPCEPVGIDDLMAVNVDLANSYNDSQCRGVMCGACSDSLPTAATRQNFGVTCEAGHCVVFDVREHELSACTSDAECVLRASMGCCEGCTAGAATAVNPSADLAAVVCGDVALPCLTCDPVLPPNAVPICESNGHCGVAYAGP